MVIHVIKPLFTIAEDNEIQITGFINENDNELTIEQILNTGEETKYYCYGYQIVVAYIERWWKTHNYRVCNFKELINRHGYTKTGVLLCYDHLKMTSYSAPSTITFKAYYNGSVSYFLDIDKWFDRLSIFHEDPGERRDIYNTLLKIEELLIPNYQNSKFSSKAPGSMSKLSRRIIKDIDDFKNSERDNFLNEVRSCNSSGFNYIAEPHKVYEEPLYYYDIKSMYPYMLLNKMYPKTNRLPMRFEGYKDTNGLAIYHIDYIIADLKPKHFPTLFCQKEQQERMGIADNAHIEWYSNGNTLDGWITSIDLETTLRDYDIHYLNIDISYCYPSQVIGSELFGKKLQTYFDKKEAAQDPYERQAYKGLINKFFGCLSMKQNQNRYKVDDLTYPSKQLKLQSEELKGESPLDLGAFTTAYARQYITELALIAGYENVVCISTDAVVVKDGAPLEHFIGNKMGDLSLDRVMYNTRWWRINTYEWQDENGNWKAKVAGLPSYKYKHDRIHFVIPKLIYDKQTHKYKKKYQTFNLEEDFLCQNEIDYISVGTKL